MDGVTRWQDGDRIEYIIQKGMTWFDTRYLPCFLGLPTALWSQRPLLLDAIFLHVHVVGQQHRGA